MYRAIEERRDIRNFRPDEVDDDLLWKVLNAAHSAPSVGLMQPWSFVVIRDRAIRQELYSHFSDVNLRAASQYEGDRGASYRALKLQGLLDAPVNVLVTCDTRTRAEPVLGRFTMRHMDEYSTCLAVQNLWLAARSEGLGVGWMSLMEPEFVAELFHLPTGVLPVAYLTVGYPVSFPASPLLEQTGWSQRVPLSQLVYQDRFGRLAKPAAQPSPVEKRPESFPIEADSAEEASFANSAALQRQQNLTKPDGSLGRLEELALQLARIQAKAIPSLRNPTLLLFAADHGVAEEGVSAYLPSATSQMMYQFIAGAGAVNVLCRQHGVQLRLIDVGIDHDFRQASGVVHRKVRRGSRNIAREPAMTPGEMKQALEVGRSEVLALRNVDVIALGEMGIGNTTASSAVLAALTDSTSAQVVGKGTGVGAQSQARKREVVERALRRHPERHVDAVLQCLGGFEIAALVGAIEQAAALGKLIVLDGFITSVAALVAVQRSPRIRDNLLASHLSAELAHRQILSRLQLSPLLDLKLRLGEGTGAVLGLSLLNSAVKLMREMSTYEEANLKPPLDPRNEPSGGI